MKVVIIKYNAGNTQSVVYALNRLGIEPEISDQREVILSADKVIFPGVGEASTAMNFLKMNNLDQVIKDLKQPVLGICVGLQLLCQHSEENNVDCLGIIPVNVKKFPPKDKVPHMGWNTVNDLKGDLFKGISEGEYVYFVHSYFAELSPYTIATTNYILPYSSALKKDNFYAVQYHTEKSSLTGAKVLKNFIDL